MSKKPLSSLMRLRTLRHITQKELADALGVTENTVANWERGRAIPKLTVRQFKTLLTTLEISPEQLPDDFGPPMRSPSQN
jgi:transcriptional regulator with XRE-family HTH domain